MANRLFLAHFPLLRIDQEKIPFLDAELWQLPFDVYNKITFNAFDGMERQYEAAQPVFLSYLYRTDEPAEITPGKAWQSKLPTFNRDAQHQIEGLVEHVWTCLNLACPLSSWPSPRLSLISCLADAGGDDMYELEWSTQGDADHEYIFLSESAGAPIGADIVRQAQQISEVIGQDWEQTELSPAIRMLLATTTPTLGFIEQLTLATIGLEQLLLPDVRKGMRATFARRIAALISPDEEESERIQRVARDLYDARSTSVHGGTVKRQKRKDEMLYGLAGPDLLARAIIRIAESKTPVDTIRAQLDASDFTHETTNEPLVTSDKSYIRQANRLLQVQAGYSVGFGSGADMTAPDDHVVMWAPLIGLGISEAFAPLTKQFALLPLSGPELLTMEHKDVRRDFINQLWSVEYHASVMMVMHPLETKTHFDVRQEPQLRRVAELGVVSLRMSGLRTFTDPELLGPFIYEEKSKRRRGSVLRQTIEQQMMSDADYYIDDADRSMISECNALLQQYEENGTHDDIEHILTLFRRSYDDRYMPWNARANLMIACLEAMIGRATPEDGRKSLGELIVAALGSSSDDVNWYLENGRKFRNGVAHGNLEAIDRERSVASMHGILEALLYKFIGTWNNRADDTTKVRPGQLFVDSL